MASSKAGELVRALFQRATRGTQKQQQQQAAGAPDAAWLRHEGLARTNEVAMRWGAPSLVLVLPPHAAARSGGGEGEGEGTGVGGEGGGGGAGPASHSSRAVRVGVGAALRRLPSDAGTLDRACVDTCCPSPRPHEVPTGYRGWYLLLRDQREEGRFSPRTT